MIETMPGVEGVPCKMAKVPIGAYIRSSPTGTWQQVTDVVRVRDGSGDIRLTFANGDRLVADPNELIEIRTTGEGEPGDANDEEIFG